jgi:glucose dehydrogenase
MAIWAYDSGTEKELRRGSLPVGGQATPAVYSVIGSAVLVIPAKGAEQRSRYVRRLIGAFEVATDPEDMINGDANEI